MTDRQLRPELLLEPPLPEPLHGLAPRTIKGRAWWDKHRKAAYARMDDCCHACGVHKSRALYRRSLEGHESYEIDWENGRMELREIVALCHCCHNYIHSGRLRILLDTGKIDTVKYNRIIEHGNSIVAGLAEPEPLPVMVAAWDRWVLVVDGDEYPSRFRNRDEWAGYYRWLGRFGLRDSELNLDQYRKRHGEHT